MHIPMLVHPALMFIQLNLDQSILIQKSGHQLRVWSLHHSFRLQNVNCIFTFRLFILPFFFFLTLSSHIINIFFIINSFKPSSFRSHLAFHSLSNMLFLVLVFLYLVFCSPYFFLFLCSAFLDFSYSTSCCLHNFSPTLCSVAPFTCFPFDLFCSHFQPHCHLMPSIPLRQTQPSSCVMRCQGLK